MKLIYKIKSGIKIISKENIDDLGSYEPPFKKENRVISGQNTYDEISNIIMASRDGYNNAIFSYNGNNFDIINFIQVNNQFEQKEYPFFDSDKNIIIKSNNDKLILLITKRIDKY